MRIRSFAVAAVALLITALAGAPALAGEVTVYEFPDGMIQSLAYGKGQVWYTVPDPSTLDPAADPEPARLGRLNPRTGQVREWVDPTEQGGLSDVLVAFGSVWFSDEASGQLGKVKASTGKITVYDLPEGADPSRVAAGFGYLWYTTPSQNVIGRFNPHTGDVVEYPIPTDGAVSVGIDTGFGAVWFAEVFGDKIGRLDPRTGEITEYELDGVQPIGISVGARGVWYVGWFSGIAGRLDPRTGAATQYQFAADGTLGLEIIAGPRGDIWLPIPDEDALVQIDAKSGQVTEHALPASDGPELGLTSGAGDIWLGSDVITRFSP